jgi:hypothetical protein
MRDAAADPLPLVRGEGNSSERTFSAATAVSFDELRMTPAATEGAGERCVHQETGTL